MKYIDMRQQWVQQLRNKDEIAYTKVAGTDNDADYFTKVHPRPKHLEFEARLMKRFNASLSRGGLRKLAS